MQENRIKIPKLAPLGRWRKGNALMLRGADIPTIQSVERSYASTPPFNNGKKVGKKYSVSKSSY
jgi:hypothetical protein